MSCAVVARDVIDRRSTQSPCRRQALQQSNAVRLHLEVVRPAWRRRQGCLWRFRNSTITFVDDEPGFNTLTAARPPQLRRSCRIEAAVGAGRSLTPSPPMFRAVHHRHTTVLVGKAPARRLDGTLSPAQWSVQIARPSGHGALVDRAILDDGEAAIIGASEPLCPSVTQESAARLPGSDDGGWRARGPQTEGAIDMLPRRRRLGDRDDVVKGSRHRY